MPSCIYALHSREVAPTSNLATLPQWPRTSSLGAYVLHPQDTGHLISHVDTEGRTHECSDKSRIFAGRYQVPDVVFPKHGPTFCPRLWSSTVLPRELLDPPFEAMYLSIAVYHNDGTLPSDFIKPTRIWKSPIRSTHGFATEAWDLEWDALPSTIPILGHDQSQRLLQNLNQTTGFQRRKAMRVVGAAFIKRTPARNYTGSRWRQIILGSVNWQQTENKSKHLEKKSQEVRKSL